MKIALTGEMGSGKSTAAKIIQEINPGMPIVSFASPIKTFLSLLFSKEDYEYHYATELKPIPKTWFITYETLNNAANYYRNASMEDDLGFDIVWPAFLNEFEDNIYLTDEGIVLFNISSRQLQQRFGTDICKSRNSKIWINTALNKEHANGIIIDDLRFEDEYKALVKRGFTIIKLIGNSNQNSSHSSESFIKNMPSNYTIYNNYCISTLKKELYEIIL
jgi:hypothetical protein